MMASPVGLVAPALLAAGLFGLLVGFIKAFSAVGGESIDPSQKARILGEGISEAINCAAFSFLVICAALLAHVLTRRNRNPPRGPVPPSSEDEAPPPS